MESVARAPSAFSAFFFRAPAPTAHVPTTSHPSCPKLPLQHQAASLCPMTLTADAKTASALSNQALVPVGGAVVTVAVFEGFKLGFPTNVGVFDSLTALVGRGKGTSNGAGNVSSSVSAAAAASAASPISTAALPSTAPAAPTTTLHGPASSRAATTTGAFAGHHGSTSRITTGTAISSSPFADLSPPSTRVTSALLVSFLVNYSVLMSDWWHFKHTARDRLLACLGTRWPLAAVVAHTSDPVKVAALATAATAAAAAAAAALAFAAADAERFPQLQFFRQPFRPLGWGGGRSSQGGEGESESEAEDGEGKDGEGERGATSDDASAASGSESDGDPRVSERKWFDLLGGWSARGAADDDDSTEDAAERAAEGGREDLASVMRDDLDPSMVWGQRRMDLDAENMQREFLGQPGFSFSAAGLLFPYHLGVTDYLQKHGYITEHTPLAGSSAGAIVCATIASGVDPRTALHLTKHLSADCRANGTAFRLGKLLRAVLEEILPSDAHLRCNGRIRVAVTQVFGSPRGVLVDQFDSRQDLIDALITSSFVPGYLEPRPATRFRDRICVDGGLSHFMPPTASEHTVRVCAFPASALGLANIGISPDLNPRPSWNMRQLFSWALEPAEDHFLDDLFDCGAQDAASWAQAYEAAGKQQQQQEEEAAMVADLLSLSLPLSPPAAGLVMEGGAVNSRIATALHVEVGGDRR